MKKIRAFLGFLSVFVFTVFSAHSAFGEQVAIEFMDENVFECNMRTRDGVRNFYPGSGNHWTASDSDIENDIVTIPDCVPTDSDYVFDHWENEDNDTVVSMTRREMITYFNNGSYLYPYFREAGPNVCNDTEDTIEVYCPDDYENNINDGTITCNTFPFEIVNFMRNNCRVETGTEINKYTISLMDDNGDIISGVECSRTDGTCYPPEGDGTLYFFDAIAEAQTATLNFSCGTSATGSISAKTVNVNSSVSFSGLHNSCTYANYRPTEWSNGSTTVPLNGSYTPKSTSAMTWTLQWTPASTVTFNLNGGSWSGLPSGKYATYPTITSYGYPTRSGYVFTGFYTASSGGTQVYNQSLYLNSSFSSTSITADTTLYAQWAQAECVQSGDHFDGPATPTITNNKVSCDFQCDKFYSPSSQITEDNGTVTVTCDPVSLSTEGEKRIALNPQGGKTNPWTLTQLYYYPSDKFVCNPSTPTSPCTIEDVIASASADVTINNPIQADLLPSRNGYTFAGFYAEGYSGDMLNKDDENQLIETSKMFITPEGYVNMDFSSINSHATVFAKWVQNCTNEDNGCSPSFTVVNDNIELSYTCDAGYEYNAETGTCVKKNKLCNEGSSCDTYTFFFFETVEEANAADGYSYPQNVIDDKELNPILTLTFDRDSTKTISDILNDDVVKQELKKNDRLYYIEQWVDNAEIYPSEYDEEITVQNYLEDGGTYFYHSSFYIGAELPRCNGDKLYIKTNGTCGICPDGTKPSVDETSFYNTCVKKNHYTCDGTFNPDTGEGLTCAATEYEITYSANGESVDPVGAPTKCTVESDDITLPTDLYVDGYEFKGWLDDSKNSNKHVDTISKGTCTDKKSFTADLAKDAPTLTYNLTFPENTGFSGGTLTVKWLEGEEEKTETRNLATTIQQYITYDSYNLPIPTLPGGFKFNGWYPDKKYEIKISTINNSGDINVYGKVEPIQFTIIAGCDLKDKDNNSITCSYNSLNDFHDECTVEKLKALCNDTDRRGYVLKDWVFNDEKLNYDFLGSLSKTDGAKIKLNANYVPQYNICIKNPTDTTQCKNNNETCFADDDVRYPVYAVDVEAEGKVYSGIVKIGVDASAEYDDTAKALSFGTPGNDSERINFTCSSGLVNTKDNTIYIEYQYCSACAENTTATCTAAAALNDCLYNYTCNTGYEVPSDMQSDDGKSFSVLDDDNKQCLPKLYDVKFNGNPGTGDGQCSAGITGETVDTTATVAYGTTVINGYMCQNKRFLGWSADKNATDATYFDGNIKLNQTDIENYSVGDEITLYAIWVNLPVYTVNYSNTYNNIAGTWNEEPTTTKVVSGGTIQLPSDNSIGAPLGYKLAGWNVCISSDFTNCRKSVSDAEIIINNNIWIAPNFEEIKYLARFLNENGALFTSPSEFKITTERINTPNNGPEKTGYTFDKWCIQQNATAPKKCYAAGSKNFCI